LTEINTNTRPLRRLPDLSWSGGSAHSVCEFCSVQDKCNAGADRPTVCNDTVPALSFQDETGLSHLANTFRVGSAWVARLRVGDRVGLYNAKTNLIFGYSRVIHIDGGSIGRILRDHAHANHLMLATPITDAARELATWLRRNYGPRIINPQSKLTAIYLLREHEQAAEAAPEGCEAGS
jgi:hypothetical protein